MKPLSYCTIYLVRHGQTVWNVEKRIQGHQDAPLTELGIKQAEDIRGKLQHVHFDAVFSSDLYRAKRTAEIIALERQLAINTSALLRERNHGQLEGKLWTELDEKTTALFDKIEKLSVEEQWNAKIADEYESDEELSRRFITYLREIAIAYPGKTVLVVSHGGTIRTFLMAIGFRKKGELRAGTFKNAGYVKIESDGIDFFVKEVDGLQNKSSQGVRNKSMIRQAQKQDFEGIKYIRETLALDVRKIEDSNYRVKVQRSGFLMNINLTREKFESDLQKIYLVYEENGKVNGFLRVDEEQEMRPSSNVFWFTPELKEIYFSLPHANIGGIAVLPEVKQKGAATAMLNKAIEEVRKKRIAYSFAFVALSPVTNFPSMMFHEKNGFERILVSLPHNLFGMKNYQSFLYGKKL